jgi:hypothetical protein
METTMARHDRPFVAGAYRPAPRSAPAREDGTHTALSAAFRSGEVFSYSWEPKGRHWLTWATQADWDATEREGRVRRPDLAALGHGPAIYHPAVVEATRRLSKAQLVAALRRLELPAEAVAILDAA